MASDGNIDKREITLIKTLCTNSPAFNNFNFEAEINLLVNNINAGGHDFILSYFAQLKEAILTDEEQLTLIYFAIQTINADDIIEYSELVLATGSYPFVPPIPGREHPHCHVYRTIADLDEILAIADLPTVKKGVVVGGGPV